MRSSLTGSDEAEDGPFEANVTGAVDGEGWRDVFTDGVFRGTNGRICTKLME